MYFTDEKSCNMANCDRCKSCFLPLRNSYNRNREEAPKVVTYEVAWPLSSKASHHPTERARTRSSLVSVSKLPGGRVASSQVGVLRTAKHMFRGKEKQESCTDWFAKLMTSPESRYANSVHALSSLFVVENGKVMNREKRHTTSREKTVA